jgi:hypothetical protein
MHRGLNIALRNSIILLFQDQAKKKYVSKLKLPIIVARM